MERLTKRLVNGIADYNYPKNCYFDDGSGPDRIAQSAFRQKCIEQLAKYEDSKLSPELVRETAELAVWVHENGLDEIKEWIKADRAGRLVVLPAKTVFELTWDAGPDCDLVCPVSIDGHDCCDFCDKGKLCIYERKCRQEHIKQIGKTVFLTCEEAEAALEAMKDE